MTDSPWLTAYDNKRRKWAEEPPREFVPNFRYEVAKTQPYKGNRKNPKPFHFYNILAYMLFKYDTRVSEGGFEADDMLCMEQTKALAEGRETIICSRDKDLRICPGKHFSWECGGQGAIWPHETDRVGHLKGVYKASPKTGKMLLDKVLGYGLSFFFYQMLVGDTADYIPGLPSWGSVKAYELLKDLKTEDELFNAVKNAYKEQLGPEAKEYFREMSALLWMVQEKGKVGYEASRAV